MKESADATASAIIKLTLTEGTIQRGARPGTRTTLASIIVCRVRSARTKLYSLQYKSHDLIDHVARTARVCSFFFSNRQLAQISRVRNSLQPAFFNEFFINCRPTSRVDTSRRNSERRGFTVDRATSTDHEIAGRDHVCAMQGRRRNYQTIQRPRRISGPLDLDTRKQYHLHVLVCQQHLDCFVKQGVLKTVIERVVRRWTHQDQHIISINTKLTQLRAEVRIGLEVCEVNIFFRAVITTNLADTRSIMSQTACWKTRWNDDTRSEAKREMVCRLIFVVNECDGLDSQGSPSQDL